MFVDQITIYAKAGNGGDGVARWRHEKFVPNAGPAGGNGGNGGDVYIEAVRDLGLLSKYSGHPKFTAEPGEAGQNNSRHGKSGEDITIYVPVGSVVTDIERNRTYEFFVPGHRERIFKGGRGGFGNEHFKSSVNRIPQESTQGKPGEEGSLKIELTLVVDVGIIGFPNAGKSSLLNAITNAQSRVGAYPFTTLNPHLGDFYGYTLADIPGLIEGASTGKGLGHTFLRHVTRTKMLLHVISLEEENPENAYYTILNELKNYEPTLAEKETWIVLSKNDLINQDQINTVRESIDKIGKRVFVLSVLTGEGVSDLHDALVSHLRDA